MTKIKETASIDTKVDETFELKKRLPTHYKGRLVLPTDIELIGSGPVPNDDMSFGVGLETLYTLKAKKQGNYNLYFEWLELNQNVTQIEIYEINVK